MVPSSCSLSTSMVELLSGVLAPLARGVGWLLIDSIRELRTTEVHNVDIYNRDIYRRAPYTAMEQKTSLVLGRITLWLSD